MAFRVAVSTIMATPSAFYTSDFESASTVCRSNRRLWWVDRCGVRIVRHELDCGIRVAAACWLGPQYLWNGATWEALERQSAAAKRTSLVIVHEMLRAT